jgi:hypothetical protein
MSAPGSVTNWLTRLKEGDPAAAEPLGERSFRRIAAPPRRKPRPGQAPAADR